MNVVTFISIFFIFSSVCLNAFDYPNEPPPGELATGSIEPSFRKGLAAVGGGIIGGVIAKAAADILMTQVKDSNRTIHIFNELDEDVWVRCRDKNLNIGDHLVEPDYAYVFSFDRSFWGVSHFWCNAWYNGPEKMPTQFPVYNEGAPADNNVFAIRNNGIFIKVAAYNWERFRFRIDLL